MPDFSQYAPMISAFMTGPNAQPGSEWRAAHPRIDQFLTQNPNWQPGQGLPGGWGGGGRPGAGMGGSPTEPRPMFPGGIGGGLPGMGGGPRPGGFPEAPGGAGGGYNTGIVPPGMGPPAPRPNMGHMGPGSGLAPGQNPTAPKPMFPAAMNPGSAVPQMGRRPNPIAKI